MNETFEQMVRRLHTKIPMATQEDALAFAARIRDELCKGQEPTHWWNPKHPTLTIQLTKPSEGGGWEPAYLHPAPIPADMALMPREPPEEMMQVACPIYPSLFRRDYSNAVAAYEKETRK